jgi:hypothetical protein
VLVFGFACFPAVALDTLALMPAVFAIATAAVAVLIGAVESMCSSLWFLFLFAF